MKYLKIAGCLFIGCIIFLFSHSPKRGIITTITSPNGQYCANYRWSRLEQGYGYYFEVYRKKDRQNVSLQHLFYRDSLVGLPSDMKWVGDTIEVKGSDLYADADNSLLWIEVKDWETILHFVDGFATNN